MSVYKKDFLMNASLSVCSMACRKVVSDLGWKTTEQNEYYIATQKPLLQSLFSGSLTLRITLEASSQNLTTITYNGFNSGIGPLTTKWIKDAISIFQERVEIHILEAPSGCLLTSKVNYLGGHPLIPKSEAVVIGLGNTNLLVRSSLDGSIHSIHLLDIVRVGTGRPKTAREIYDEAEVLQICAAKASGV